MKRTLLILYWVIAILLVAIVLLSFEYRFGEAVLIGTLFMPGALAVKYLFPKAMTKDKSESSKNMLYISMGIIIAEFLLVIVAHIFISTLRKNAEFYWGWPQFPEVLGNPVFIAIMVAALAVGYYFTEQWLNKAYPTLQKKITFLSERKPVSLDLEEILYVESNDTVTTVYASDGRCFKNSTLISQWEAILGSKFIRIHRSFLVNKAAISSVDVDMVFVGSIELPVSRKYKASLMEQIS